MDADPKRHSLAAETRAHPRLPDHVAGIDGGLTLTKVARANGATVALEVHPTSDGGAHGFRLPGITRLGVTGARTAAAPSGDGVVTVQEIDAAARGAVALLGVEAPAEFVLALLGTGTAFALVREGRASHLGGSALGGGSFSGIARRWQPGLTYDDMIAGAIRGDRTRADLMVSDAYPEGIGRIGPNLTAAHLSQPADSGIDDALAALLNLHGENIAQIAASRAIIAGVRMLVLAGGFAHGDPALVASITSMAALFGVPAILAPSPGYAGAVGAALIAAEA